jgi:protein-disulfide isomerase
MRILLTLALAFVVSAQQPADPDAWKTASALPSVDFLDLTPAQQRTVLKMLRDQDCSCQCGMKVAECRIKDPNCYYSKALAKIAIDGMRAGKPVDEIKKLLAAGPVYKRPKLLEDPVQIATAGAPVQGPADAKITVVEFSDFECPYCVKAMENVRTIMAAYPGKIKLVYKQFPLSMHPHAQLAATASLAAQSQGKFWEMHNELFAHSRQLNRQNILVWAKAIGLDMDKFTADLDSGKFAKTIEKDASDGEAAGVMGTPAFFINGKLFNGPMELPAVKPILDAELKGTAAQTAATK